MTEETEPEALETKRRIRANVKQIFLTREINIALNKMCGEKEVDEKNGILLALAYGLFKMGFMSDVRFERMNQKYSFSIVKAEDQTFLDAKKKQAEGSEAKIKEETDNRARKWVTESKTELDKMTVEDRREFMRKKMEEIESEVRKEGEKQE